MKNNANNLSRSISQHDGNGNDAMASLHQQHQLPPHQQQQQQQTCSSSCSSLTSGIDQSDQSIFNNNNDRLANSITTITTTTSSSGQNDSDETDHSQFETVETVLPCANVDVKIIDPKLKSDIKVFVDSIFTDSQSITPEKKAEFGQLVRSPEARLLFAMFVDDYRVNSKKVSELTFYSLAQYFSIVLLECLLAEDFRPAKVIMNMMFTYYHEQNYDKIPPRDRPPVELDSSPYEMLTEDDGSCRRPKTVKTYLYTLLKDQEIFKSIRFWTTAFYESVIIERNNHPVFVDREKGKLSNERRNEESDCSKNITFGLLGSFIHNMSLLDLSHEFCQEFLDKHSTIADLSEEQLEMLRNNMKSMFNGGVNKSVAAEANTMNNTSSVDKASLSIGREKLATFLHKLSNRLNHHNTSNNHQPASTSAQMNHH